jgi:hypothetical protein
MNKVTLGLFVFFLCSFIPATAFCVSGGKQEMTDPSMAVEETVCENQTCSGNLALKEELEEEQERTEAAKKETEAKRKSEEKKSEAFFLDQTDYIDAALSN